MEWLHNACRKKDQNFSYRNISKDLILKGDLLKLNTDFKTSTTETQDAGRFIHILDEMRSDTRARGKCVKERDFIKKLFY